MDFFQELVGGRSIAYDPIHFFAILVDKKEGRRPRDVELFEEGVPDLVALAGPVEDEVFREEFGVLRIAFELLNQQSAGPSATREEFDQEEFVFLFGLSQRLVEGSAHELNRLGGGQGYDEDHARKCRNLFHADLSRRKLITLINIQDLTARHNTLVLFNKTARTSPHVISQKRHVGAGEEQDHV